MDPKNVLRDNKYLHSMLDALSNLDKGLGSTDFDIVVLYDQKD